MWQFLFSFSGTLVAILAVLGAVWAFIKYSGKTAVEQWLKRSYKAWELETEKPYKEDFKRLEDSLARMAKRDDRKLDTIHGERQRASIGVNSLCYELNTATFVFLTTTPVNLQHVDAMSQRIIDDEHRLWDKVIAIYAYLRENKDYITIEITAYVQYFCTAITDILKSSGSSDTNYEALKANVNRFYKIVDTAVRELTGVDL